MARKITYNDSFPRTFPQVLSPVELSAAAVKSSLAQAAWFAQAAWLIATAVEREEAAAAVSLREFNVRSALVPAPAMAPATIGELSALHDVLSSALVLADDKVADCKDKEEERCREACGFYQGVIESAVGAEKAERRARKQGKHKVKRDPKPTLAKEDLARRLGVLTLQVKEGYTPFQVWTAEDRWGRAHNAWQVAQEQAADIRSRLVDCEAQQTAAAADPDHDSKVQAQREADRESRLATERALRGFDAVALVDGVATIRADYLRGLGSEASNPAKCYAVAGDYRAEVVALLGAAAVEAAAPEVSDPNDNCTVVQLPTVSACLEYMAAQAAPSFLSRDESKAVCVATLAKAPHVNKDLAKALESRQGEYLASNPDADSIRAMQEACVDLYLASDCNDAVLSACYIEASTIDARDACDETWQRIAKAARLAFQGRDCQAAAILDTLPIPFPDPDGDTVECDWRLLTSTEKARFWGAVNDLGEGAARWEMLNKSAKLECLEQAMRSFGSDTASQVEAACYATMGTDKGKGSGKLAMGNASCLPEGPTEERVATGTEHKPIGGRKVGAREHGLASSRMSVADCYADGFESLVVKGLGNGKRAALHSALLGYALAHEGALPETRDTFFATCLGVVTATMLDKVCDALTFQAPMVREAEGRGITAAKRAAGHYGACEAARAGQPLWERTVADATPLFRLPTTTVRTGGQVAQVAPHALDNDTLAFLVELDTLSADLKGTDD